MNVYLYNTPSPPNMVSKTLSNEWEITDVRFIEDNALSVTEPSILLNIGTDVEKLAQYNYAYIPKFKRYYWFAVGSTRGGLVQIDCNVDPLMSFRSDIKDNRSNAPKQYIARSEIFGEGLIVDNLLPMFSNHNIDILPFGDDVYVGNCGHVILETVGKGGTVS